MRVALATTHLPLRDVPDAITHAALAQVLRKAGETVTEIGRVVEGEGVVYKGRLL